MKPTPGRSIRGVQKKHVRHPGQSYWSPDRVVRSGDDLWQTGTAPVPGLYPARQTPNMQPTAPAQPASNQTTTALPSWYSQVPGIPVGGGRFYAGLTVGIFYDDNVFATNTNRLSDWAIFQRPEFAWIKEGQNYTFSTDAFIEGREYSTYSSEDEINGGVGAKFTVMPDNDTQIVGSVRYLHEHLDRGSSETVIFDTRDAIGTFEHAVHPAGRV
jgi:hypothetical protein